MDVIARGTVRRIVHRGQRLIADGSTVERCARVNNEKEEEEVVRGIASPPRGNAHSYLRALRLRISAQRERVMLGSSQAARAIRTAALGGGCPPSTGGLSTSSSPTALQRARGPGRVHLGGRFPLRCFQRLSPPAVATRRCPWQGNRDTSGPSDPVLSY